jgi:hypothetical protein
MKTSNQLSECSRDSVGSQLNGSSFATGPDPEWFTDFILYDSDDPFAPAHKGSDSGTSELATIHLFASSPVSSLAQTHPDLPNSSGFCSGPVPTGIGYDDSTTAFDANISDLQWNPAEPALTMSPSSCPDTPGQLSQQSSPENSTLTQDNAADRLFLPRIAFLKCPTCQSLYPSESRLRYVLQT